MFRSRIHAAVRDPVFWIILGCIVLILFSFLNRELRSENGLYTYRQMVNMCKQPGGLGFLCFVMQISPAYASEEAFFRDFVPDYLDRYASSLSSAICCNSSAMIFALFFPFLFICRRLGSHEPQLVVQNGRSRSLFFLSLLLRLPMIFAWMMPAVFCYFLLRNMFLSGVAMVPLFYFQALGDNRLFPYWTWTQNDDYRRFWSEPLSAAQMLDYLLPCLAIIVFWTLASYAAFRWRDAAAQ